jgi:hypothetical protein
MPSFEVARLLTKISRIGYSATVCRDQGLGLSIVVMPEVGRQEKPRFGAHAQGVLTHAHGGESRRAFMLKEPVGVRKTWIAQSA